LCSAGGDDKLFSIQKLNIHDKFPFRRATAQFNVNKKSSRHPSNKLLMMGGGWVGVWVVVVGKGLNAFVAKKD
jgi:hypothetical protein